MTSITLSSKGQLTIPRQLRYAQSLAAGAKPLASIDAQGRLVQMPSYSGPKDLFRHRPPVARLMHIELLRHDSDQAD
jgi:hypothetical protein